MNFLNRCCFDLDTYTREEMEHIFHVAASMKSAMSRDVKKFPALKGRTVATLFFESSTRTKMSFELAAKRLSADVVSFSASTSALNKGESLKDTVLTLDAMGIDLYIIRHSYPGAPQMVNKYSGKPVLNAGDGRHAHPTQALLDMFTLWEKFGKLDGLKVTIVGDILHSRVVRSNLIGMPKMGIDLTICSPPTFLPVAMDKVYPKIKVEHDLKKAIKNADVVMGLRMQLERQTAGLFPSFEEYTIYYGIDEKVFDLAKKDVVIMHPGPMNRGIEIVSEVADSKNSVIEEQVTNGVAIRMALLYLMLGGKADQSE